jgi:hypothetical protein
MTYILNNKYSFGDTMMDSNVTNNHLKAVVEIVKGKLESEEDPSLELLSRLICELKVSNLLLPANEKEDTIEFEQLTSDEDQQMFIPVFTDIEEYNKHCGDDAQFNPIDFDFNYYMDLVLENEFEGLIINPDGNFLTLERKFLEDIDYDFEVAENQAEEYTPEEIKDIFESVENESLVEFIKDDEINEDIERLYVELSNSTLINLVVSDEPLDEYAKDGIICDSDVDGFGLCTIENDEFRFGAVFSDKKAAESAINPDSGLYYYGQVTVLSELFEFILLNDMDGVVINPNSDDYIISRSEILPQASGIEIVLDNPRLINSLDYAFPL